LAEKVDASGIAMVERIAASPVRRSDLRGHEADGCDCDVDRLLFGQVLSSAAIRILSRFQPSLHEMTLSTEPSRLAQFHHPGSAFEMMRNCRSLSHFRVLVRIIRICIARASVGRVTNFEGSAGSATLVVAAKTQRMGAPRRVPN
jgi:hypothetical protein